MKKLLTIGAPIVDICLAPFVFLAAYLLGGVRALGIQRLQFSKRALLRAGVFPIRNHYYEPLFDASVLRHPLDKDRELPGIDWNEAGQLALLDSFHFEGELADVSVDQTDPLSFHMGNGSFEAGDAEYLYNMIRLKKPKTIIEIGSGSSTLMARRAIARNRQDEPLYECSHICIEPYEAPWLEKTGVTVLRQTVETVDKSVFSQLEEGDILFIDSSHIIRPQGDVLFEYLELLPTLKSGVIVHIHDIFSPKDYRKEWVVDQVRFWNEQYLLEAFLTCNNEWEIIGAVNFLQHKYHDRLRGKCPFLTPEREPASFYIRKTA